MLSIDLNKTSNNPMDFVGETVTHSGYPGTIWVVSQVSVTMWFWMIEAVDHTGAIKITDDYTKWSHSQTGMPISHYWQSYTWKNQSPQQELTARDNLSTHDSNMCTKCNSEIKDRTLFMTVYRGCMC